MTQRDSAVDLSNLPRFLDHYGHDTRDPKGSAFARQLLDLGCEVTEFWGPEQMDVWLLTLKYGRFNISFNVERGFPSPVSFDYVDKTGIYGPRFTLDLAVLAWARASGVDMPFEDPYAFAPDLTLYGTSTLDWLEAGNTPVLVRINAAWKQAMQESSRLRERIDDPARKARLVELLEVAIAP